MEENKLNWSALEYEEKTRSMDWFWALGIAVVAISITAIIYSNYFFAILIILSGILLGFFAIKKPEMVSYELNKKGLKIKTRLFPYDTIKSFFVKTSPKSILFIKSGRMFMPILSIPIENNLIEEIKDVMLSNNIKEEEIKENPSEKIMDSLGF